ncbi:MAG TPA: hypothetical protein VMZ27_17525 [Candidatus Saccharimonadales bacterium]|nr:hypothetical protein [Candidatus Saccharimonadales bacterium]
MKSILSALLLAAGSYAFGMGAVAAEIPKNYKLQYAQDFEKPGSLKDFVFTDPHAWKLSKEGESASLELFGKSKYDPKHRSPFNIALLADKVFGDFVLDVELQSTIKPYPHQDMCLFFGFLATNKFYYTHIAVKPDPIKAESHAHDIFIVNDAPRLAIAKEVSNGVTWGDKTWHKLRVERKLSDGSINVYFDDMSKPIMTGADKTFGEGYIGFGSFDDTGMIDNIKIYSPKVSKKKTQFFRRSE